MAQLYRHGRRPAPTIRIEGERFLRTVCRSCGRALWVPRGGGRTCRYCCDLQDDLYVPLLSKGIWNGKRRLFDPAAKGRVYDGPNGGGPPMNALLGGSKG